MFEITARTNAHNQTLSIDGEEFGGGPYQVCVNRAHAPVLAGHLRHLSRQSRALIWHGGGGRP